MSYWRLWTTDLARGRYTPSTVWDDATSPATIVNSVDGDPSTLWLPGATSATWRMDIGGSNSIVGFGIANHNLKGRRLIFSDSEDGSSWTQLVDLNTVATNDDFVYVLASNYAANSGKYWRAVISGGSGNPTLGIFSILTDYGYDSTGTLGTGGALVLGNEGGVRYPIGRSIVPANGVVQTVGGLELTSRVSAPFSTFTLNLGELRDGADLEWWKIRQSFELATAPDGNTYNVNPGWAKGLWLTSDEHTPGAATFIKAWYCHPVGGLDYQITGPGGRVSATITLRTRSAGI